MANKWRYFIIGGLSLCVVAFYASTSQAQFYNLDRGLAQRLDRLERSVRDMQGRINVLEQQVRNLSRTVPQPAPGPIPRPAPAQWTCHIEVGGYSYSATRPTQQGATDKALDQCRRTNGWRYCPRTNVVCDSY